MEKLKLSESIIVPEEPGEDITLWLSVDFGRKVAKRAVDLGIGVEYHEENNSSVLRIFDENIDDLLDCVVGLK